MNIEGYELPDRHWDIERPVRRARWKKKLTAPQVQAIRQRYAAGGISQDALGREFGVSGVAVLQIVKRRVWVDLPDLAPLPEQKHAVKHQGPRAPWTTERRQAAARLAHGRRQEREAAATEATYQRELGRVRREWAPEGAPRKAAA